MIRLSRAELGVDADTALDLHLHTRITAVPGAWPDAPLPSARVRGIVRIYVRSRPFAARRLAAARAWRRHHRQLDKAALN